MTKIILQSIALSYFKGIKSLHLDLNEDISCIYADNGCGKTTISDAFMWALFGKNTEGRTDFGIKTLDTNGNVIPNVEHSVTLTLLINDTKRAIKRQWVEERVTRRGVLTDEVKHHGEFFVDGMAYTKKDFDNFISSIIGEQTFRAVTNPLYFLTLPWKEQRHMLQDMTGEIDFSSIRNNKRFEGILLTDQFKGIEEYLQHLRYNIRQIKEKIESIPARIEEQTRTCPQPLDWEIIESQIAEVSQSIKNDTELLNNLKNGSESASRKHLRDKIEFTNKRLDDMKRSAYRMASEDLDMFNSQTEQLKAELLNEQNVLKALQAKLNSNEELMSQAKQTLIELDEQKQNITKEWQENNRAKYVEPTDAHCPMCGRSYEGEDLDELIRKQRETFNTNKAINTERLRKLVSDNKENRASAEALISSYELIIAQCKIDTETQKLQLQNIENRIVAHTNNKPATYDERLANNPSYTQAQEELKSLEQQLENDVPTDNSDAIAHLSSKINESQFRQKELISQLATKDVHDAHQARISELNTECETLNTQLDELLSKEDLAVEYQFAENELVEQAVNSHFSLVHFQLFDTLNDGTKKPNCIAYVNGVPYADLNSSAKLNAGRDVLNALSKYYGIYAPVLSDNAEGTNTFLPILSQDIRLYVSTDKQLTLR